MTLLTGFLFILGLKSSSWVREDISIGLKDYLDIVVPVFQKYSKQLNNGNTDSASQNPLAALDKYNKYLKEYNLGSVEEIIKNVKYDLKIDFGLKQMCVYATITGFKNPIKLFIPTLHLCLDNDIFQHPTKYGLPQEVTMIKNAYGLDCKFTFFLKK